jgi:imidazolonepropionase-like amidohydrolase
MSPCSVKKKIRLSVSRPSTFFVLLSVCAAPVSYAQISAERVEGLRDNTPRWHALTGAKVVIAPGKTIDNGVVVIKDGVIVAAGANVPVPAGARVWKLDGRTIYAGFIDLASSLGVPASMRAAPPQLPPWQRPPGMTPPTPEARLAARSVASRNRMVRADADVAPLLEFRPEDVKSARDLGFTTVLAAPSSGVFRGQSALINLATTQDIKSMVLIPRAAQHVANEYERSFTAVSYPTSAMGAIALVRQTLYDARWYRGAQDARNKGAERAQENATLDALSGAIAGKQPVIYQADAEQDFLRVVKVRDEFNLRLVALGNGYEYRRAAQLKSLNLPVIVPLNFPVVPEVENPDSALDVPLEHLQHWEHAPSNMKYLADAGVAFAITANGLREPQREFWANVRQAVKRGLPSSSALAALTTAPAKMIGAADLGTIEPGRLANLVIANGDLFESDAAEVELSFVDGRPYAAPAFERFDARGKWTFMQEGKSTTWEIIGTRQKPQLKIDAATCDVIVRGRQLVVNLPCAKNVPATETIVAEFLNESLRGTRQLVGGAATAWSAQRTAAFTEPAPADARKEMPPALLAATYPVGAYSVTPARSTQVLVKNATIWTSAGQGKLEQADLLVRDGKIAAIGKSLTAPADVTVIDAAGKHVTAGIIDAHSHTAINGGVNEASSSITAEVRIGDVIDATDVSIYRQLAGGVTAANVLHGSANSIGGQNQVIKMRWGRDADGLKFQDAMPGIKFALGENVKQSNWENANSRYPQTRMGVEQIIRDGFQAAREYQRRWAVWRANKAGPEPRRDLQLDTLAEILDKKRVIHIHSYRADEILMFTKLAKEFGFTVATFQHVLEGYKVADAIASIGAGGSSFSDWWGYKMEVVDAIPFNGALMHRAGVLTSFNSDSDELARRLNTEAAKAVKYGGLSETEALNFVTINPAKQLRIDNRVGSLEVGKDADFVIWSAHPLSTEARAEQTWIDGARYFDRSSDATLRDGARRERERLVTKALPIRLARLAQPPGGTRPSAEAPGTPQPLVRELMEYLAMQSWLHQTNQYREGYWEGGAWHECTEDAR